MEGGVEEAPMTFLKIRKKYPDLGKKGLDCVHLVTFFIQKNPKFFPVGPFFFVFDKMLIKVL